jgi:hypothetical protein
MLREERTLRQSTLVCPKPCEHCKGISKEITALIRAELACGALRGYGEVLSLFGNSRKMLVKATKIADAVRGENGH